MGVEVHLTKILGLPLRSVNDRRSAVHQENPLRSASRCERTLRKQRHKHQRSPLQLFELHSYVVVCNNSSFTRWETYFWKRR